MQKYGRHLLLWLKRFILLLIAYSISRLFFYLLNAGYFSDSTVAGLIKSFLYGIRFDIAAIVFTNFVFLLWLLPGNYKNHPAIQGTGTILFLIINSSALLVNFADARFFDFINKRSTSALLTLMSSNSDVWKVLPRIITDYWYVTLSWIITVTALWKFLPGLDKPDREVMTLKKFGSQAGIFIAVTGLMLLGARGTGLKPLSITDAAAFGGPRYIPLVLNTTFSILKTVENENLEEKTYFTGKELKRIYDPVHICQNAYPFRRMNVVIFILESFSKEYCGFLGGIKGYTPNLDSLLEQSLVFPNAFANGTQSYEAMPAIIAGIPSLMDRPYSGSNYADNTIESLPGLLGREGYTTAFFHGGNNGTMGFSNFARIAGIEKYMGRDEYGNDKDYDGYWGIWDEPYLKYFAREINSFRQPFFASVFTLSSHHPYNVPEMYKNYFTEGQLPILKSISYADYSLGQFFRIASNMKWFDNTLFVFTADHAAQAIQSNYNSSTGMFAIPVAFYHPADPEFKGIDSTICQQIDIMPTVLDYLHYPHNYFAFGTSLINKQLPHFCISYVNGIYQLIEKDHVLQFDSERVISFSSLSGKQVRESNPETRSDREEMEQLMRAIIQTYNYSLIHNETALKTKKSGSAKIFSNSDKIH